MTEGDEIIVITDIVSTKKANTIATKRTNVISTALINCHGKKSKRLLYFAHSFSSGHITIDNYYYMLLCKTRRNNIKCK